MVAAVAVAAAAKRDGAPGATVVTLQSAMGAAAAPDGALGGAVNREPLVSWWCYGCARR